MSKILENYMLHSYKGKFFRTLVKEGRCVSGKHFNPLRHSFDFEFQKLMTSSSNLLSDPQSKTHLMLTALVLTGYRTLKSAGIMESDALHVLKETFIEPQKRMAKTYTRWSLLFSRDAFKMITKLSKRKESSVFGASFKFEREYDSEFKYFVNVKKCFYHDFFKRNNAPQLTAIFCEFDNIWADEIGKSKSNVQFQRPSTLGYGGTQCQFQFTRSER